VTGSDSSPESICRACEESLHRLNTDYIDLYQFHDNGFPAEEALPVRETLETLLNTGKIRAYGWSTDFPDRAEVFAQGMGCTAIQLQLNVLDNNPAVVERYNLAAINRGPLAMGLLTGKYTAERKASADDVRGEKSPEWMKYFKDGRPNQQWLAKRDAIRGILTSGGRTVTGCAGLAVGAQLVQHCSHPGLPHCAAGRGECWGNGVWSAEARTDARNR
jgi:aryl-alcohol dehydrogenase-like predicted oxidoreductase